MCVCVCVCVRYKMGKGLIVCPKYDLSYSGVSVNKFTAQMADTVDFVKLGAA